MQRLSMFLLTLVSAVMLFSCDPTMATPMLKASSGQTPTVVFSDNRCGNDPLPTTITDLGQPDSDESITSQLKGSCGPEGNFGKIFVLPTPKDGRMSVAVHNATGGRILIQPFARKTGGGIDPIGKCVMNIFHVNDIIIDVPSGYEDIYLRVEALDYNPKGGDSYVSVSAYDNPGTFEFSGFQKDAGYPELAYSCQGGGENKNIRYLQQLIFTSCSPGVPLKSILTERGYKVTTYIENSNGSTATVILPNGRGGTQNKRTASRDAKLNDQGIRVERDFEFYVPNSQRLAKWGGSGQMLELLGGASCKSFFFDRIPASAQRNILVANIDSGVDRDLFGQYFAENLPSAGKKPLGRNLSAQATPSHIGYNYMDGNSNIDDEIPEGHGTTTAGVVLGGYLGQKLPLAILHQKVFTYKEKQGAVASTLGGIVQATHDAIDRGARVINMSLGIEKFEAPYSLECAISRAVAENRYVVTSAGNYGESLKSVPQWPANFSQQKYPTLYTVTSFSNPKDDRIMEHPPLARFANFGDGYVDIATYETAQAPVKALGDLGLMEGTSISAPIITRMIASALGNGMDPESYLKDRTRVSKELAGKVTSGQFIPICGEAKAQKP